VSQVITIGLSLFLVWLFATAGVHKFQARDYYRDLMSSYFESLVVSRSMVVVVGATELFVAVLLLLPQTRLAGLLLAALILSFYAAMMAVQIKRGRDDIACGCAGPASMLTVSPALVLRNLLCAILAAVACLLPELSSPVLSSYTLAVGIAAFIVVLYVCSDQLIANAQMMAGDY
jgi:uncharacterized membrane protein